MTSDVSSRLADFSTKVKCILAVAALSVVVMPLVWLQSRHLKLTQRIYRIGFDDQPPQHFPGRDGKPTGLIVDLINEAARRRGIRLQWMLEPESSDAALGTKKVDLWPVMTIRPERKGIVYITDPYREDTICLVVRSATTFARLEDLGKSRIAFDGEPLDVRLLRPHVPAAKLLVVDHPRERLEAVCQGRVDAAYFDEYTAITTILGGVSCEQGLRIIHVPELNGQLGVGATFEAKPAADTIRAEIGKMALDGTLDKIASRWSPVSTRNLEIANALARAQATERWLILGISGVGLLLFFTLWQAKQLQLALSSAKAATALKSQFLANMSHEIRTPMNAILGMTALAMDTGDHEEQAEYLNDVMRAGESLLSLLNDILDLSKIEAGKLNFEQVEFDPADVIRVVCSLFEEGARQKGLILAEQMSAQVSCQVRGDPTRLRQALVNLVGNAIKFTEKGRVDLETTVDSESDQIIRICFRVRDTGIGISREAQRHIFESFVQEDGSVTRKYGGTGLGLSIAKELVSRMGGELLVDSAPGQGSTFWFILPFAKVLETGGHDSEFTNAQKQSCSDSLSTELRAN